MDSESKDPCDPNYYDSNGFFCQRNTHLYGMHRLNIAVRFNQFALAQEILESKVDVNIQPQMYAREPYVSIVCEARDNIDMVKLLVSWKADINKPDVESNTSLHLNDCLTHGDKIGSLLDLKANVNAKNSDGETVLMSAARRLNWPYMSELLDAGARLDDQNRQGKTVLDLLMARTPIYYAELLQQEAKWRIDC